MLLLLQDRYSFTLPRKLPPSFKGVAVKFLYHIDIRSKLASAGDVKSASMPFRVLNPLANIAIVNVPSTPLVDLEGELKDFRIRSSDDAAHTHMTTELAHAAR